uniref:Ras-related protein RABD2a n=1 Tax=Heterorhabditis bacteriophora TaxID=37862 RepID=A0A1I7X125_HETBA
MERAGTSSEEFRFKVISTLVTIYVILVITKLTTYCQASFQSKHLSIDGCKIELNIWDTAGQEKYHALGPIYYSKYASSVGALYHETSAKENLGISQVFEQLCQCQYAVFTRMFTMLAHARDTSTNRQGDNLRNRRTIELIEDEPNRNRSKCCK